ncbi:MAG: isoaspartyl peptidase/L-asparaginase [Saprospiraceae bacterium]
MKHLNVLTIFLTWLCIISCQHTPSPMNAAPEYAIAIHGGAGAIKKENMTAEMDAAYRAALDTALMLGEQVLRDGGSALDAVCASIEWMEDSPLFNAGRGAVFTYEGRNEHDASIMEGSEQKAGAVGGVHTIHHPIRLARAVMEQSPHVLLTGSGAEQFALEQGIDTIDPGYFYTERRWESLQKFKEKSQKTGWNVQENPDYKYGTVGCVALDKNGNLAAGTSTGGMTGKRWNRIGDSPIIGAGTYADNTTCAVSCTGHGEYFIRYAVAHDLSARMKYQNITLEAAAEQLVLRDLVEKGGEGGLIALDKMGNISCPFNSAGMYRAWARPGEKHIAIYKGE